MLLWDATSPVCRWTVEPSLLMDCYHGGVDMAAGEVVTHECVSVWDWRHHWTHVERSWRSREETLQWQLCCREGCNFTSLSSVLRFSHRALYNIFTFSNCRDLCHVFAMLTKLVFSALIIWQKIINFAQTDVSTISVCVNCKIFCQIIYLYTFWHIHNHLLKFVKYKIL